MLTALRKQLDSGGKGYYLKLVCVTENLIQTFDENRRTWERFLSDGFSESLLSPTDIEGMVGEEVAQTDIPHVFGGMMDVFARDAAEWMAEDEPRITRMVNSFFAERAFGGLAGRSITRLLADKYDTTTDAELTNCVYKYWIQKLTQKASPLFKFDAGVWDEYLTSKIAIMSVPCEYGPIKEAAQRLRQNYWDWAVEDSDSQDGLRAIVCARAFPLSSYASLSYCERAYYDSCCPGTHLYEGGRTGGESIPDWRNLSPLMPQSLFRWGQHPEKANALIANGCSLFDKMRKRDLVDFSGCIHLGDEIIELPHDGDAAPDVRWSILKDYFVSSPAIQRRVEEYLATHKASHACELNEGIDATTDEL